MAAATSVPLMSDIEGGGGTEERQPKSDIKNDFSYHNNVAGAPALIRKGFLKKVQIYLRYMCFVFIITNRKSYLCLFEVKLYHSFYRFMDC